MMREDHYIRDKSAYIYQHPKPPYQAQNLRRPWETAGTLGMRQTLTGRDL